MSAPQPTQSIVQVSPEQWGALVAELAKPTIEGTEPALSCVLGKDVPDCFEPGRLVLLVQAGGGEWVIPARVEVATESDDRHVITFVPQTTEPVKL